MKQDKFTTEPAAVQHADQQLRGSAIDWRVASPRTIRWAAGRSTEEALQLTEHREVPHLRKLACDGNGGSQWCPGAGWKHRSCLTEGCSGESKGRCPCHRVEERFQAAARWIPGRAVGGREKDGQNGPALASRTKPQWASSASKREKGVGLAVRAGAAGWRVEVGEPGGTRRRWEHQEA
jgi:hypothetical protein